MKTIKENWKLVLIVAAGIIAVIFMCIFGIQGAQNYVYRKNRGTLQYAYTNRHYNRF